MKKILFIVPYPQGKAPSQRFRFEHYFAELINHGYKFSVAPFWSDYGWNILYQKGKFIHKVLSLFSGSIRRFFLLFKVYEFDLVFLHREAAPLGPPVFEFVITKILNKKIIYDFDDAIWLPNTSDQNNIVSKLKFHSKVKKICRWSWKVSCGNEFLMNFAQKFNDQVFLNPTVIDTSYHKYSTKTSKNSSVTIGWTGTHSTVKYLDAILPVLEQLKKMYDIKILIISNEGPDWDFKEYDFIPWRKDDEIEQLSKLDIGIMPLEDSIWEQGKCGFKALQYMALEKPVVASKVGVNKQIIDQEKNGYLCKTNEEWFDSLEKLILSKKLRVSMGEQGRQKVIQSYSVKSNEDLFFKLLE